MGVEKNRWRLVDDVEEKRCPRCLEWIPHGPETFYRNKSASDGFDPYCKGCRNMVSPGSGKRPSLSYPAS